MEVFICLDFCRNFFVCGFFFFDKFAAFSDIDLYFSRKGEPLLGFLISLSDG